MTPDARPVHHYVPRNNLPKGAPTKAEHDALVAEHGRPFTQDPRPLRADTVTGRTRTTDANGRKNND